MKKRVGNKKAFLVCAALFLFVLSCAPGDAGKKPRYVFLLIGDGMGYSSGIIASRYLHGTDDGLAWEAFPFKAWTKTGNANMEGYDSSLAGKAPWPLSPESPESLSYLLEAATDSAAAATAMACGVKTRNGLLGWKDGEPVENISEILSRDEGFSIGILSSVPFNHATPAAFIVHETGRGDYLQIAESIRLSRIPLVLAGGGHPAWCATYLDRGALASFVSDPGWTVAQREAGADGNASLALAAAGRPPGVSLLAVYGGADGSLESPMPVNHPGSPAMTRAMDEPSLAATMVAAARSLARESRSFFIMGEQGDIDWANHANDLPRMIGAVASLDETVRSLISYIREEGDDLTEGNCLVIVTADHATGLPRFASGAGMEAGVLPVRVEGASPTAWEYPTGTRVEYRTSGHGNEIVRFAAWPERAAAKLNTYLDADGCLDNTSIFDVILDFASAP